MLSSAHLAHLRPTPPFSPSIPINIPSIPFHQLPTSFTDAAADMQLFWEAFPAECGKGGAPSTRRTTYMFSYSDADPERPDFSKVISDLGWGLGAVGGWSG